MASVAAFGLLGIAAPPAEATALDLPCLTEPYDVVPAGHVTDITRERDGGSTLHVVGTFSAPISARPVDGTGPTYAGRLTVLYREDDGVSGGGHVAATFIATAVLTGSDGTRLLAHTVAHVSATAIPDVDPDAIIRAMVEHASCSVT